MLVDGPLLVAEFAPNSATFGSLATPSSVAAGVAVGQRANSRSRLASSWFQFLGSPEQRGVNIPELKRQLFRRGRRPRPRASVIAPAAVLVSAVLLYV